MSPNPNPGPELLPCPFCGGEATYQWHSSPECWIECQTCFAVGPNDKDTTTEQHVTAWNTRALSPQTLPAPGEVELREAYRVGFNDGADEDFNPDGFIARTKAASLATVAAANDEAFARGVEAAAKVVEDMQTNSVGMVHAIAVAEAKAIRALATSRSQHEGASS